MSGTALSFDECEKALWASYEKALTPEPLPSQLFHYTDGKGLLGILETGKIWASDVKCLNDHSEYLYGLEIAQKLIKDMEYPPFEVISGHLAKPTSNFYVACFCEKGDLLSQWRGYARHGDAYAIGFSLQSLIDRQDSALIKVTYDTASHHDLLRGLMEEARDLFERFDFSSVSEAQAGSLGFAVFRNILSAVTTFKHPTFHEEAEWRILAIRSFDSESGEEFRPVAGAIIPYVSLPIPTSEIEIVRQGPGAYREINQHVLERLLKLRSCSKARVCKSVIPFSL